MNRLTTLSLLLLSLSAALPALCAQTPPETIIIRSGVAVGPVIRGGRRPFSIDVVQHALAMGTWVPPKAGDIVRLPDGAERTYATVEVNKEGWLEGEAFRGGGYFYTTVESPSERIALLIARGNNLVYVNGEPRMGDPYQNGYLRLPVKLRRGTNHLLFVVGRGQLHAEIQPVTAPVQVFTEDATLPDVRQGESGTLCAALPVVNNTDKTITNLWIQATIGNASTMTALPPLPPLTVRKVGFRFAAPTDAMPGSLPLSVTLQGGRISPSNASLSIRVRKPKETFKRTFISQIDGTVQYYAVNPSQMPSPDNALLLSLHGASVEAIGQADAYGPKDWVTLVAPTNRRPFGFDWEDWGRLDALEVLHEAAVQFPHDPARVMLTGHSMGGHGTWAVGSLFPDRFAALGPSAGWISFTTYGAPTRTVRNAGEKPGAAVSLLERASNIHDTLLRETNILQQKVYIVHGDADDNVPVEQARQMREELTKIHHPSVQWHEQKGAGHWWDASDAPGADCVDWKPMFEVFQNARLTPSDNDTQFAFTTINPAVSSTCRWVQIEQQERFLSPSMVRGQLQRNQGHVAISTENISRLTLLTDRISDNEDLTRVTIDGKVFPLTPGKHGPLHFKREGNTWKLVGALPASEKNPSRSGPFKQAFANRFILVYPTGGNQEENDWGYARARFDAEAFYYRGNGSPDLIADRDYNEKTMKDRSVILYGNASINTLWKRMLKNCPVRIERDVVQVGDNSRRGDNLACAFVHPKPGSETALVGVVGGTGMIGLHLTDRLPYFVSGVALPDGVVFDPKVLIDGADAVLCAFYFGNDWKLKSGEIAWR